MIGFEDPDFANEAGATDAMTEMFEYAGHLAAKRRSDPRDDLTSVLVHAEVDGERLDELGFNMFFMLLILAGNETTRNAISGGMLALSENREQWQKLLDDRSGAAADGDRGDPPIREPRHHHAADGHVRYGDRGAADS